MDLQGNIERFGLPEIFQFLASNRKTGTLALQTGKTTAAIYLKEGIVIYAFCSPNKNRIGEIAERSGKITRNQLDEALKIQKKTHRRLGEILVELEIIERSEMEELVKFQVKETIYSLLAWEEGIFKFYENRFPTEEKITVSLSAENIILEGVRRIDELSRIKITLPPLNSVLVLETASDRRRRDIMLEADEWNILASIDGYTTINEILEKVAIGRLEALKIIKGLILAGLVSVVENKGARPTTSHFESMMKQLDDTVTKFISKL